MGIDGELDKERARLVALDAVEALGHGFDVTTDYRLKYRKSLLVELRQKHTKDISIPGGIVIPNVSEDVKCDKGERMRFTSDVMQFQQMSQLFNKNASIEGKIPLGLFNAMYDFSGSWQDDANQTKSLAFDGYFITLYRIQLTTASLVLREEVKKNIPSTWDPEKLARFIEKYGTHIIVDISIGGQDVLYLKESYSSLLSTTEVHKHLKVAGDSIFTNSSSETSSMLKANKISNKYAFTSQTSHAQLASVHSAQLLVANKDVTIISRRRGGLVFSKTHNEWQETVNSSPDAISMSFIPIASLISGVAGGGFLQHAINLYLRYKPPVDDIRYFLDFQVPRQWIPVYNELPLGHIRKQSASSSLQFSFMGPKVYVNTSQVIVNKKPVTGIRLYMEGRKNNRLAIHLQHLSTLPRTLEQFWNDDVCVEQPKWHGSDEANKKWFEPVQCKFCSHICTVPIKYSPEWTDGKDAVFVVTGAQLEVKAYGLKNVLHLKLLFSKLQGCTIQKSKWEQPPASQKSTLFSSLTTTFSVTAKMAKKDAPLVVDSAVYPGGPPRPVQSPKLRKFVDTMELTKGPQDNPGHWQVTAAKLELDGGGKISLRVKFSLLNYM